MTSLAWLVPAALTLGMMGLAAFLWALRSGQFDDLEGAKWRAISDDNDRMVAKQDRNQADDV